MFTLLTLVGSNYHFINDVNLYAHTSESKSDENKQTINV
jgi:hypothetical protein